MTEKEQNQLAFYSSFCDLIWESGWLSSDTVYDLTRQAEQESGFDSDGEEVQREIGKWRVKYGELYWISWGEDGTEPTFLIDNMIGTLDNVPTFDTEKEANDIAIIFGGEIEKVGDDE
ncbi:hypothetical protein [Listeria newyorkensis]|uniref:Uncharacterized protein n=1 Tax=Listeria newyorkensis TaxID=1497681 RepID=A0A841Z3Q5_9LIST|nr:hypothetical protein [Listeria newyorkensis]MBC1459356.1 hypothetical protein [Listeria newyorkensis]